jgi:hypothetical protein
VRYARFILRRLYSSHYSLVKPVGFKTLDEVFSKLGINAQSADS